MTYQDQIDTVRRLAKSDESAALKAVWRFAVDAAPVGWMRSLRSVVQVYEYAAQLMKEANLVSASAARGVNGFEPIRTDSLICRAKSADIYRLLTLTNLMFGRNAYLWQRGELNAVYPRICHMTTQYKNELAHLGVMPMTHIAEMKS